MSRDGETLVLYSRLALYPVHWEALEEIVKRYAVRAIVLAAPPPADLPTVHQAHGLTDPGRSSALPIEVRLVPHGSRRARLAWIARQHGVSSVIPGARNPDQARANAAAGSLELPESFDAAVRELYDREIRASVHDRW